MVSPDPFKVLSIVQHFGLTHEENPWSPSLRKPGVYALWSRRNLQWLYVGQSQWMSKRIPHARHRYRTAVEASENPLILYTVEETQGERLYLEAEMIGRLRPVWQWGIS